MDDKLQPESDVTLASDSVLLGRLANGDAASFEVLFHRHYDRVYGLLFRLTGERGQAEDLTQETFIRLHDHARSRRRGNEENVSAWLYRVAMNLGYNALRSDRRRQLRERFLVAERPSTADDGILARREERAVVREVLRRLPERQAKLLILRQMDFSYAECAAICAVTPGSVGTLLARAGAAFRQVYLEVTGNGGE